MKSIASEKSREQFSPVVSFTRDNVGSLGPIASFTLADGKLVTITGNVDDAMGIALHEEPVELDEASDRRLLRKIDVYLMPLICLLYACQFMDKTTTSYAAVMGFKEDFNMVGDMYSWCGTAFYLGYLVFEFPANTLIQRFPLSKATAAFILVWGVILCLHATPQNYAGVVVLRTLLGMLESAVTPAMVIFTSQWYRKEEQFLRTALWFSCNGIGITLGGGIAYGVAAHALHYSMAGWKILFVVTGLMTVVIGVLFLVHIPDSPADAWFLSAREKALVVERIRTNQQGFGNRHFKKAQFREALLDVNVLLFFLFGISSNIPNGATTNFGSILLNSDFGYTSQQSLYMNMPCGAVEFFGCILLAYSVRYVKHRMAISIFASCVTIASACMLAFASSSHTRLAGYYLMYVYPITTICILSMVASNVAGHTKKITCNAIFLIGYCVGNLIGPQTFIDSQAPGYTGGKISFVVCNCTSTLLLAAIYYSFWRRNKKKERDMDRVDENIQELENIEFADLTDKENPYFRYML